MQSIASSHCILTITRDFYPKIRRRLQWKIFGGDLELKRLVLTWSSQVDLMAATLRFNGSIYGCITVLTHVDAVYCYGPSSVVCRSVCLSVCLYVCHIFVKG